MHSARPGPGMPLHPSSPPAQPARPVPGDRAGTAGSPPAAEPRTDLSELAGEVEEGDGHAHGLQQHGGHQHGPAGLRGAGAARRQHPGAGWAGLGAPGAPGAQGRRPAANDAPPGPPRSARPGPARRGMERAGRGTGTLPRPGPPSSPFWPFPPAVHSLLFVCFLFAFPPCSPGLFCPAFLAVVAAFSASPMC